MPFVSKAQKRKFDQLLEMGRIDQKTYDKIAKDTPEDIPEYGGKRPLVRRGPNTYRHYVKEEKPHE